MQTNHKAIPVETEKKNKINETLSVIYSRRAVRRYKDIPVERKLIEQVINAGRMAPSAMNMQPWKFYVLTGKEEIKSFSRQIAKASVKGFVKMGLKSMAKSAISALLHPLELSFLKEEDFIFHRAPVVIFITAPKDNEWAGLDIGACSQNMMLAAKSLGLDTCPVGLAKFVEATKLFPKLKVPKNHHVLLALIVGYGDESPEMRERKMNNVYFISGID